MGNCCGKPAPPPNQRLVGVWTNVPEAKALHNPGIHLYRRAEGWGPSTSAPSFPKNTPENIKDLIKIVIHDTGWISYMKISRSGHFKCIDFPVTDWEDGVMKMGCGSSLKYNFQKDKVPGTLVVEGVPLYKFK